MYNKVNNQRGAYTYRQANNVYKRKQLMPPEIAYRYFKIVLYHFWGDYTDFNYSSAHLHIF
jgi:hypothetical protein